MGWQEAPVVEDSAPAAQPAWASAPVVGDDAPGSPPAAPADVGDQVSRGVANKRLEARSGGFTSAFEGETPLSLAKQNVLARIGQIQSDKEDIANEIKKSDEYKAIAAANSDSFGGGIKTERWLKDQTDRRYEATRPKKPEADQSFADSAKQLWHAALDNPGRVAGEFVKAVVIDPEMLYAPEMVPAKILASMGRVARTATRATEAAATTAGQAVPISVTQQYQETGAVDPARVGKEAALAGAGGALLHGAMAPFMAGAELGLQSIAKKKGATVTPEVREHFDTDVNVEMAKGASPTDALVDTLKKHGLDEPQAEAIGRAVDENTAKPAEVDNKEIPPDPNAVLNSDDKSEKVATPADTPKDMAASIDKAAEVEHVPTPLEFERVEVPKNATPDRTIRTILGAKGTRTIEFPDAMDKEVFVYGSKAAKRFNVSDADLTRNNAYVRSNRERIADYLGLAKDAKEGDVVQAATDYRQAVVDFARSMPEDARVQAHGAKERGTLSTDAAAEAISNVQKSSRPGLPEGEWFHYTREPGVAELRVDKANPGNARGAAIYVAKDSAFAKSHNAPRVDKQGNLGPAKPGELLKVKADEAHMFDEAQMHEPQAARDLLEQAGMTPEEAGAVIGKRKAVAGSSINQALKKFMGGWNYSNQFLKEKGFTGVKFKDAAGRQLGALFEDVKPSDITNRQAGRISPELLATLGLASLGGMGVYALTHDRTDAIAAAAIAGALPFAGRIISRIGKGTGQMADMFWRDSRFPTKDIFRDYARNVQVFPAAVDAWQRGMNAMLKGVPDKAQSLERIRDYTQGHRNVNLTPQEAAAANELRKFLDNMGQRGQNADVLGNLLENYLPGIYQKKPFASWRDVINALAQEDAFRGNYTGMSPTSRHALKKIIPDYRTVEALIKQGKLDLVPVTTDPFEIAALYAKSLNKTIANRQLVETLKGTDGPAKWSSGDPIPLIVPITTREAAARIAQGNRIIGTKFDLPPGTVEIMNKFDILRGPEDYVPIKHTALEGLRVHRDIVEPLKLLFDTSDPGVMSRGLYALSMAAKSALFSFSLFHAGALATVAGTLSIARPAMWKALPEAYKALKGTALHPEVERSLSSGLTLFHHVQDVDPGFLQRGLNLAEKYAADLPLYTGMPAVAALKTAKFAHKAINDFLWNTVHPTLKLATWMAESKRFAEKQPKADLVKGNREIATAVNDLYGGINWFELANNVDGGVARTLASALFSPQGRRWQQVLLLAPDWNVAAIRGWTEGMKASTPGIEAKASDSLYRTYLLTSGLMYLGVADYLQMKYTKEHIWQKDDWTYVDMGDGRRIQLNKHFMEGIHLLSSPAKFILNKLNYVPKEALAQLFHKEYVTPTGGPEMKGNRVVHAVKSLVKPISVDNLMNDPVNAVGGFFGIPIYGSTYAKQEEKARTEASGAGKDPEKAAARVQRRAAKDETKRAANRIGGKP